MLWLLLPCIYSFAQKSAQPGRNVTLTSSRISLGDVFNIIEKQTGVLLFFGDLNTDQLVGVKFVATPVEEALGEVLPPIGLTYEYVKGNKDKIYIKSIKPSPKDTVMMKSISGIVTDEKGQPLPGATVRVKGSMRGTSTQENGAFVLHHSGEKDILQISFTGFDMAEVPVAGKANLKVRLKPGDNSLNEQVVTAYGKMDKRSITGAITVVKGEQIQNLPNRSFDKSLQGLVPGLLVTQGTGQPGGGLGNFVLRGISTGGSIDNGATVRNPLIIIDGVPVQQDQAQASTSTVSINNPMAQLNPSDIESISVLKDAGAIALYGSKASNGVILITTKRGKAGKTRFNFRHQTDFASRLNNGARMLNQQEYLELLYETYRNTDPAYWTDSRIKSDLISKFPHKVNAPGDTSFYPAPDWQRELFNKNAMTLSNELSLSGGNDKSTFYVNLEYTKQDGVEKNTGYDRKSLRINYENLPAKWLKVGLNTTLSYSTQKFSYPGASERLVAAISPLNAIRDDKGEYIYNYSWGLATPSDLTSLTSMSPNPLAAAELNINKNVSYRGVSNLYIDFHPIKNVSFTSNIGTNFMLTEAKEKVHPKLAASSLNAGIGRINERDIRNANFITTNIIRYNTSISDRHNLNFLIGHEAQILTQKNIFVIRENITSNPLADQANIGTIRSAGGLSSKQTLLSYFGQLNYDFSEKYLLSGSLRTDGSSLFGTNKRFGTHWSAAGGWIVTNEPFMKNLAMRLNYLKIRGSLGSAGNSSAISNALRYDNVMLLRYLNAPAVMPNTSLPPGNPNIQWEKTFNWDIGIEMRLFDNRISFTGDIYRKFTSKLIGRIDIPTTTGFLNIQSNIGDLSNKGIELSVSIDMIRRKDFFWNVNANWSKNKNVLTKSFFQLERVAGGSIISNGAGENYNSFYMPVWGGVNRMDGKPQWVDSMGKVTSDYNAAPRKFVGKPQPDGFGAITNTVSYKGIEFSAMIYYQYGAEIFKTDNIVNDGTDPFINQDRNALDRWQKDGDVVTNPRRLLFGQYQGNDDGGTMTSTRYLFNGDFIRLSNLTLAYKLRESLIRSFDVQMLRFYLQCHNVATISKYSGQDPELTSALGQGMSSYPLQRTYSFGMNVIF
ncbi:SusC/RagA family TonB-linked outer membrane protein [Chitinophaga rhizophila]|uniref:SusC/RagA family TonB-linked outer membrane protein n=1 Tax=Chitinophaga rhizophila TaxID=2866212 RepID=A0ABS7GG87_9BACT|nr:SusC/RagA family TonB-linked outer membrane protein [Chitinophaga rhizophila]MBW8686326.1 SusC/RagA family TonB-linked outer membrane protein [Chitinophaga rhizophila]